jgi:hypothetical protein
MAVILAFDGRSGIAGYDNPYVSIAMRSFAVDYWPPYQIDAGFSSAGVMARVEPVVPAKAVSSVDGLSYLKDFYFRLYIIPSSLDIGNLLSSQTREFEVWNAFLTPLHIDDIEQVAADGITLIPPAGTGNPPLDMAPTQSLTYSVNIDIAGPPTIDAKLIWHSSEPDAALTITGSRVVVFPFLPNWGIGIDETIAARSFLLRGANGDEQSIDGRDRFRRSYNVPYSLTGVDAQRFSNLLFSWQGRFYGLPLWPEIGYLTATAAIGTDRLTIPTLGRTFVAGGLLMLFRGKDTVNVETRDILSADATGVTLKLPLAQTWEAGTRVVPLAVSMIGQQIPINQLTPRSIVAGVQFDCEPSQTDPLTPDIAPVDTYRGYELYRGKTNWRNSMQVSYTSDAIIRDQATNVFDLMVQSGYSGRGRSHDWFMKTLADVLAFRAWLKRRKGKTFGVWMHSAIDDFDMVTVTGSGSAVITVKTNGYAVFANQHPARRDIYIETYKGAWYARRITGAADGVNGTTQLLIDTPLGVTVNPEDVKRFCFLSFYRLAADENAIHWHAPGKAEATTGLLPTKSLT